MQPKQTCSHLLSQVLFRFYPAMAQAAPARTPVPQSSAAQPPLNAATTKAPAATQPILWNETLDEQSENASVMAASSVEQPAVSSGIQTPPRVAKTYYTVSVPTHALPPAAPTLSPATAAPSHQTLWPPQQPARPTLPPPTPPVPPPPRTPAAAPATSSSGQLDQGIFQVRLEQSPYKAPPPFPVAARHKRPPPTPTEAAHVMAANSVEQPVRSLTSITKEQSEDAPVMAATAKAATLPAAEAAATTS